MSIQSNPTQHPQIALIQTKMEELDSKCKTKFEKNQLISKIFKGVFAVIGIGAAAAAIYSATLISVAVAGLVAFGIISLVALYALKMFPAFPSFEPTKRTSFFPMEFTRVFMELSDFEIKTFQETQRAESNAQDFSRARGASTATSVSINNASKTPKPLPEVMDIYRNYGKYVSELTLYTPYQPKEIGQIISYCPNIKKLNLMNIYIDIANAELILEIWPKILEIRSKNPSATVYEGGHTVIDLSEPYKAALQNRKT